MKKIVFSSIMTFSLFYLSAQNNYKAAFTEKTPSTEIKEVKNILKFDLGQLGNIGGVGLSYERMITNNVSVSFGVIGKYNSSSLGGNGFLVGSEKNAGIGFTPEVRFYALPNYNAPRGLYLSVFYNYYLEKYEIKSYDFNNDEIFGSVSSNFSTIGTTLGWMFRIKSSFVIDLGIGPVFQTIESPSFYNITSTNGTVVDKQKSPNSSSSKLDGVFRFSLGYAF